MPGETQVASVVADLTRDELDDIASAVAEGRVPHRLKSLDERGAGQELVRQQYSGRYPFELMQNAADAAKEAAAKPATGVLPPGAVTFMLTPSALLVADNGAGFGEEQIRSICGLARSTKNPAKSVGYKGLGFKSVGEITDSPQIITSEVRFGFDDSRVVREVEAALGQRLPAGQRLPTYAFPFELTETDLAEDAQTVADLLAAGYTTVMRLPLRAEVSVASVEIQLRASVEAQLLLFLDSLNQLTLSGTSADFTAYVVRQPRDGADQVLLEVGGVVTEWLVYGRRLSVGPELVQPMGEAWKHVDAVTTAVAFPIADGRPQVAISFPLHVYFPTDEQPGFPFIAHADWALHLDRRQLSTAPEAAAYNSFLTAAVVTLTCEAALDLAARFEEPSIAARVLAPRGPATGAGEVFRRALLSALADLSFVATVTGQLVTPGRVQLLAKGCPDPNAFHLLADFSVQPSVAAPDVESDPAARSLVAGLNPFAALTLPETLALLRPPGASASAYYEHLVAWDSAVGRTEFAHALATIGCVRTQDGQVVTPASRVYFPRKNDNVSVDLPLPIAVLPTGIEGLRPLLEQAGVREFDWRNIIPESVVPLLRDPANDELSREEAFNILRAYLRTSRDGDQQIRRALREVLVPAKDAGSARALAPASRVYFSAAWTGDTLLGTIYGPFGQVEFLDVEPPAEPDERIRERELWDLLGVADCPRVITAQAVGRDFMLKSPWSHPHYRNPMWELWMASAPVAHAGLCPHGHPDSQQLRISHELDRFTALVTSGDERRLAALWEVLDARWETVYSAASRATFRCVHQSHGGSSDRQAPSLLDFSLKRTPWVPVLRRGNVELVEPGDAWQLTSSTPGHIGRRVPALARTMAQHGRHLISALGVRDAARLEPAELITLLRDLADEAGKDPVPDELVKAARWAMRALSDALTSAPPEEPVQPVPLLALHDGRHVFARRPVVVRDQLLREAWATTTPVLAADDDCTALIKHLSLDVLDEHVTVIPHELGHRPELADALQNTLDRAAPWMLALLRKQRPSAEDAFVARIKRLDVRACNELILEYSHEGQRVELPEAVAYIKHSNAMNSGRPVRIGTAYLEVSSGKPSWYEFGPELADYVGADNYGDQFAHILVSDDDARTQMLAAKRVPLEEVSAARATLVRPDAELEDFFEVPELLPLTLQGELGPPRTPGTDHKDGDPSSTPAAANQPGQTPPRATDLANTGLPSSSTAAAGDTSSAPPGTPVASAAALPELDLHAVTMQDATPGPVHAAQPSVAAEGGNGGAGGGPWTVEPPASDQDKRTNGRRGELAALAAERRRVASLGFDPDEVVVWRSDLEPFAPHDIESVDEGGGSLFIEVKASVGSDPCIPFEISQGELTEAIRLGDKYRLYRVTDVRSAAPKVTRYANPVLLLQQGLATLDLSKAKMHFGSDA